MDDHKFISLLVFLGVFCALAEGLGVNWGTLATHPLPPKTVVSLLKDNGINKVKIFDTDSEKMSALAGSGIEVIVAIPNNMLRTMNDYDSAKNWVDINVGRYVFAGGVNIKYVAVGNEPFLSSYYDMYLNVTLPALKNIQLALNDAGFGNIIKATIPQNAEVYSSPKSHPYPSYGTFRSNINELMTEIAHFLNQHGAPFMVNIYPFLSLHENPDFPLDYAFFDGAKPVVDTGTNFSYYNAFNANFDTLVSALKFIGLGNLPIIVGEVGWPTDADINANASNAQRFYNGLLKHFAANGGTPLRPNQYIEYHLFSLLDEDAKDAAPGNFERHWGIFRYDGQPKYPIDFSGKGRSIMPIGAKGVTYLPKKWCVFNPNGGGDVTKIPGSIEYACAYSDCSALSTGSSCDSLDEKGKASYAFNEYFQAQNQREDSCFFSGLAAVTMKDPSTQKCNFTVQILMSDSSALFPSLVIVSASVLLVILLL